jgi:cysteinyl-tRNA synthetase
MAKSTGNNILPREILTGENSILSKAFPASVASLCYKHTTEAFLIFLMMLCCSRKRIQKTNGGSSTLKQLNANTVSTIDIAMETVLL